MLSVLVCSMVLPLSGGFTVSAADRTVYIRDSDSTKVYHSRENCSVLAESKSGSIISMTEEDAKKRGLTMCDACWSPEESARSNADWIPLVPGNKSGSGSSSGGASGSAGQAQNADGSGYGELDDIYGKAYPTKDEACSVAGFRLSFVGDMKSRYMSDIKEWRGKKNDTVMAAEGGSAFSNTCTAVACKFKKKPEGYDPDDGYGFDYHKHYKSGKIDVMIAGNRRKDIRMIVFKKGSYYYYCRFLTYRGISRDVVDSVVLNGMK